MLKRCSVQSLRIRFSTFQEDSAYENVKSLFLQSLIKGMKKGVITGGVVGSSAFILTSKDRTSLQNDLAENVVIKKRFRQCSVWCWLFHGCLRPNNIHRDVRLKHSTALGTDLAQSHIPGISTAASAQSAMKQKNYFKK